MHIPRHAWGAKREEFQKLLDAGRLKELGEAIRQLNRETTFSHDEVTGRPDGLIEKLRDGEL